MPARYDQIGEQYKAYANAATMKIAERSMFLELVGELDGERVLDVACGTGYYTRILKQLGAGPVFLDHWSREEYERAFRDAGFASLDWEPYRLPENLLAERGKDYWHDLRDNGLPISMLAWA